MVKTTISFLLLLCSTPQYTDAFLPPSPTKTNQLRAVSSSLGDLFSGITGVAPSSLEPPRDVLSGTSIDPMREDVDLGRVYKVRVQFEILNERKFHFFIHRFFHYWFTLFVMLRRR
jgi:hypothetical protein